MWLNGDNIAEVGAMNVFFYWKNEKGENELITPSLEDGTILPGVTRQSILDICNKEPSRWNLKTSQRTLKMSEIVKAYQEHRILEVFAAGTAAIICPVQAIHFKDMEMNVNAPNDGLARKLTDFLLDIQHGEIPHPFSFNLSKFPLKLPLK